VITIHDSLVLISLTLDQLRLSRNTVVPLLVNHLSRVNSSIFVNLLDSVVILICNCLFLLLILFSSVASAPSHTQDYQQTNGAGNDEAELEDVEADDLNIVGYFFRIVQRRVCITRGRALRIVNSIVVVVIVVVVT